MDQALSSVYERFNLWNNHNDVFNYLFKLSDDQEQSQIGSDCHSLQEKLTGNDSLDINADDLCEEIISCQSFFKNLNSECTYIFKHLTAVCPSIIIELWIFLTIYRFFFASYRKVERFFSKLKLIKKLFALNNKPGKINKFNNSIHRGRHIRPHIHETIKDFANKKARHYGESARPCLHALLDMKTARKVYKKNGRFWRSSATNALTQDFNILDIKMHACMQHPCIVGWVKQFITIEVLWAWEAFFK